MSTYVTTLFGLLGGLAMFLYGMNSMSEALQKAAGERMKSILAFLTKNPLMGALAGAIVTGVLQSSSATTVMVIGFVSAGLMGLPQAISVIFGANIGTTMTAQLIAFDISDYIYPIIFVGFIVNFVAKNEKVKNVGMVIFSFGLLFEGIAVMSSVMEPLAQSPIFTDLITKVKDVPVLGILLGMCMTLVVQSSSATIAVLQSFASQAGPDGVSSVVGLTGAIPILLGDNIGTTITAILASIGQSRNAKRTAIAHSTFNITGSFIFAWIIPWFAQFIEYISPKGPEVEVISRQIANAHTTFNTVMTIVWLPLLPLMVKIVCTIIPGTDANEATDGKPLYLDSKVIARPAAAMMLVSREIGRCAEKVDALFSMTKAEIQDGPAFERLPAEQRFAYNYAAVKNVQKSVVNYISQMFSAGALSQSQAEEAAGYLAVINDVERVSDRLNDIVVATTDARNANHPFTEDAIKELGNCIDAAEKMFRRSTGLLTNNADVAKDVKAALAAAGKDTAVAAELTNLGMQDAQKVAKAKNKLRKTSKAFNKAHLQRVKDGKCSEAMTPIYSGILYNMDRIGDNCVSISEEVLDGIHLVSAQELPDPANS